MSNKLDFPQVTTHEKRDHQMEDFGSMVQPVFAMTRGETVESIHHGAAAVVDSRGNLIAWFGNPRVVTFLRSTAKPLQVLAFLEHGGQDYYGLTGREIALMCASHGGTDQHVAIAQSIQSKVGMVEADLMCGVHVPADEQTAEAMRERRQQPTPNRHNCSGKHSGMVAFSRMLAEKDPERASNLPYIDFKHPIQVEIRRAFAEMCALPVDGVAMGIDGCSAPNFAVPLHNAAHAFARLCDPQAGQVESPERAIACATVTSAMMSNPDMVAGFGRFDTRLMQVAAGRMVSKGGAEGYQGIGLMPGALGLGSPALGIAFKVADGDARQKVRPAVALEILRQLGALSPDELIALAEFGPTFPVPNWRKIIIGQAYPLFTLQHGT
jgi:L-asparaginase II